MVSKFHTDIINKLTEEQKDKILNSVAKNIELEPHNKYDKQSLTYLFKMWHVLFPDVRQSMRCSGCRKAVAKFFEDISQSIQELKYG